MLSRRSAKAFDAFIYALVMTHQEHAAELLDRSKTAEMVRQRDEERNRPIAQPSSSSSSPAHSTVAPSGSAVVSTSSSAHVPSPHVNVVPSSQQCTPSPSGKYLLYSRFCVICFTILDEILTLLLG